MSAAVTSLVSLLRSGAALVVLIVKSVLSVVLSAFNYVAPALAFHKMGRKCGIKGAWLAWIPYANTYVLGALADHQIKKNEGHASALRLFLPATRLFRLGLPFVSAGLILFLNVLTLLFAIPALICLVLILVLVTNTPEMILNHFNLAAETLSVIHTILDVSRNVLPFAFIGLVVCGGGSLILIPPAALLAALASLAYNLLNWILLILQYFSLYKVYKLFSYKIYPILFAVTLGLDLLWWDGYCLVYPLILLVLSRRSPVYTRFETEDEAFSPIEDDNAI